MRVEHEGQRESLGGMKANGVVACQLRCVDAGQLLDEAVPVAPPRGLAIEYFQRAVRGVVEELPARQGRRDPLVANPGRTVVAYVLDPVDRSDGPKLVDATHRRRPAADERGGVISASYGGEEEKGEYQCEAAHRGSLMSSLDSLPGMCRNDL